MLVDIGLRTRPEIAKLLKGYTAKKLFQKFPELKKPKWEGGKFWNSGFWNPSYYLESPKNFSGIIKYIRTQKYGKGNDQEQRKLDQYAS